MPMPAAAAERAAVLVYPGQPASRPPRAPEPPPLPLAQVAGHLRQRLAERNLAVIEGALDQALRAHAARQTQPLLMKLGGVRELLRSGQQHLAEVELEQAEAALREAERRCSELLLLPEAPGLLAEVLRWRGVALFELHRRSDALALFRRALALQPTSVLTEADVRPEVASTFRRAAAEQGPPVTLRVVVRMSEPTRASPEATVSISIDGVEVPTLQGRAEYAVPAGEHVVVARAPGYLPMVQQLEVSPEGGELTVDLRPDPVEAALQGMRRRPSAQGLAALCDVLSLSEVVLAAVGQDAGQQVIGAQRHRCATGTTGPAVLLRADRGAALRPLIDQLLAALWHPAVPPPHGGAPDLLDRPALATPRPEPPPRVPLYARPWIWIGAAVVVSAALLGVALRPQPEPTTTLVVDPRLFALCF
ncbi:MAG: hypothetical protein RMK29_06225 [Myxococcales bacterium]|nr:hypothetical protein [Myxococcota bacterium]MDW8281288.1 hypothetical protein [Myxococcales bacterium]